jgi:AMOP domain
MFKSSLLRISPIILVFASCNMITCSNKQPIGVSNAKKWYDTLPSCPCENPDKNGVQLNDGWAKDKGEIEKYHSGATECFRSYPVILTDEGASGQQCCYDSAGYLITDGSGAGTPDKESTCAGENKKGIMTMRIAGLFRHYRKDVVPWDEMGGKDSGWKKYNLLWVPNQGQGCKQNATSSAKINN